MEKPFIDAVVAFSFGRPANIRPNQVIANEAVRLAQKYGAPIVTQRDVPLENRICVEFIDAIGEMNQSHVSTFKVVQRFAKLAQEHDWKKVLVVAAPGYLWRCVRDLEKLSFVVWVSDCMNKHPSNIWFCKNSTQWWTRNYFAFWMREICIRLTPWWLYKKIAGD